MNNCFWLFDGFDLDAIAVIDENERSVSYSELNEAIESMVFKLPIKRSLIFLKVNNTYASLIMYLACLRARHPVLLVDTKVEDTLLNGLIDCYEPNFIINNYDVQKLSTVEHELHEDLTLLMATSGTTGSPKLVRLSKENITSCTCSIVDYLGITKNDKAITTLPMSYSYGLSIINSHLSANATIVLNEFGLISREFWNKVTAFKITSFSGVPFIFQLLKKLKYKRFDTSSIRYLTQAGGKLDDETLSYFQLECDGLDQEFIVMYGQTEAAPRISYLPSNQLKDKIGSIGIAIPGGSLSLLDEAGYRISCPNKEGEICYSGDNVMMGYADKITDLKLGNVQRGRLLTGDIGYFDEDGFYFITGRAKRFIKMFGLRISLDSLDNWLATHGITAVSSGKDDLLIIFFESTSDEVIQCTLKQISQEFKLNINSITSKSLEYLPRKNGGKIDFKALNETL